MPNRNAVIFTMGTRGDVQPYLFLAQALRQAGIAATIATHPCWRTLVQSHGVAFAPIGPDIDISYEAAVIRGNASFWLIGAIRTMKFVSSIIASATDEIYQLCKQTDLVIASHSYAGAIEAQACQKPLISITLHTQGIPQKNKPKTRGQRFVDGLISTLINPMTCAPFNKIRRKYQLAPIKSNDELLSPHLNLIPVSTQLDPPSPHWEGKHQVVGYWHAPAKDYQPPQALANFLSAGDVPIIVALGAMSFESKEDRKKLDILVNSLKNTGMRAVIQGFDKSIAGYPLPDTMIHAGSIPHDWLFAQGYCIIHHGGLGTTASALLAGKPSIVIPHVLDQFGWADKVYKQGVGTKPIPASKLNEAALTDAIMQLKQGYGQLSDNARILSQKIHTENGLSRAIALISEVCDAVNI